MTRTSFVVCESTSTWTAALRVAVDRAGGLDLHLQQVGRLADVSFGLQRQSTSLVAVEVGSHNLGDTLTWLPPTLRRFPRSRCVGLVHPSLRSPQVNLLPPSLAATVQVDIVLREAGAQYVATSPRHLEEVIDIARRHIAICQLDEAKLVAQQNFSAQVWSQLPWQPPLPWQDD